MTKSTFGGKRACAESHERYGFRQGPRKRVQQMTLKSVRLVVLLGLGALLGACGGGGGADNGGGPPVPPDPGVAGAPYFPLAVGAKWRGTENGSPTEMRVVGTVDILGEQAFQLQTVDGTETSNTYYVVNATGVYVVPGPASDELSRTLGRVQVARFPLRVGETFRSVDRTISNLFDVDGDGIADPMTLQVDVTVVGISRWVGLYGSFDDALQLRTQLKQTFVRSRDGTRLSLDTRIEERYARGIGSVAIGTVFDFGPPPTQYDVRDWVVGDNRSDTVAPTVTSRSPAALAVTRSGAISVQMSEVLEAPPSTPPALELLGPDGRVVAGDAISTDFRNFAFSPSVPLANGIYTARFKGTVEDWAGNRAAPISWTFSLDARGPTLVAVSPAEGSLNVPTNALIEFTFDEPPDAASLTSATVSLVGPQGPLAATARIIGNRLSVTPDQPLVKAAPYQVRVSSTLTDAVGNALPEQLSLSFTTDPGRFALPVVLPGLTPGRVPHTIMADLDGDGRRDLVVAQGGSGPDLGTMRVVRATGSGSFAPESVPLPFSTCTGSPTAADFDNDGRMEIVVASGFCAGLQRWSRGGAGEWIFEGAIAAGDQWRPHAVPLAGSARSALLTASGTEIQLLRPATGGGFAAPESLYRASVASVVGDLNGDGRVDVALVDNSGLNPALVLLLQQADARFTTQSTVAPTLGQVKLAADINGDGRTDLVVAERFPSNRILLYLQTASGMLATPVALTSPLGPAVVRAGDLNGDGRTDLLVRHDDPLTLSSFTLFTQAADSSWTSSNPIEWGVVVTLQQVQTLEVADFNGDGVADILLGNLLLAQRPLAGASRAPVSGRKAARWPLAGW
jgi:hypothetical protein